MEDVFSLPCKQKQAQMVALGTTALLRLLTLPQTSEGMASVLGLGAWPPTGRCCVTQPSRGCSLHNNPLKTHSNPTGDPRPHNTPKTPLGSPDTPPRPGETSKKANPGSNHLNF